MKYFLCTRSITTGKLKKDSIMENPIITLLRKAYTNVVELQNIALNSAEQNDSLIDIYQSEKDEITDAIKGIEMAT